MTRDGMCGVFIPDRVLAGWWRSQWKASDRQWAGRCLTGCGRGQVYKCECGWDIYLFIYLFTYVSQVRWLLQNVFIYLLMYSIYIYLFMCICTDKRIHVLLPIYL